MEFLSGKYNVYSDETLLFEAGDEVEYIAYISSGSVIKDNGTKTVVINEGNFICHDDLYSGFYSYDYTAMENSNILIIPATSALDIVQFLSINSELHKTVTQPICCLCRGLYDMYTSLYDIILKLYNCIQKSHDTYLKLCDKVGITPTSFSVPKNTDTYNLQNQPFGKNLLVLRSLSNDIEKEQALLDSSGNKYLKLQIDIINRVYVAYDDMFYYLKTLIQLYTSPDDSCLFSIVSKLAKDYNDDDLTELLTYMKNAILSIDAEVKNKLDYDLDIDYNRVNFYFMVTEHQTEEIEVQKAVANVDDIEQEVEFADCDMNDILLQLCNYAGYTKEQYDMLNVFVHTFINTPDKYSKENEVRAFRKGFTEKYFELYEAVFMKYATTNTANIIVKLFLDYGLLDERLVTDMQIQELLNIAELNNVEGWSIYRMSDWLLRIYNGLDVPSKNEFDQDYVDHIRERKKNEALSQTEEKRLLEDNVEKVHYEINNMLKYNTRLLNGNLLSFYPMLHMEAFDKAIENLVLTSEAIVDAINVWREYDYSVFYREIMYSNPEKKIEKEVIQKEIFPTIVLFPVVGINGIMWQDISGKRSNSSGRFFLPSLFNGNLEETILTMLGRFRWELCKTMQGVAWNNIQVPSLTSEFIDYIQFYRKNKELTADKKDAIKTQLTKCRNNMRDFFVYDYTIWLKYEATGAMRLNKFSRRMLATYCPMSKVYRDKQMAQPIFEEAMKKFNVTRLKKIKEYQARVSYYQNKGIAVPQEVLDTKAFYEN